MKNKTSLQNWQSSARSRGRRAFSLVEVVVALAICALSLVVMLGLLSEGLTTDTDSREQMQAANLATLIVTPRREFPTNVFPSSMTNVVLPVLNASYPTTATTNWIDSDGQKVPSLSQAAYTLSYKVGTNAANPNVGLIWLRFTWPPGANGTNANVGRYEQTTQVLMTTEPTY